MTALKNSLSTRCISTAHFALLGAASLFAAFMVTAVPTGPAEAQMARTPCADRATVLGQLARKYEESPVSMGLTNTGAVLEIVASEKGTWTVLVTTPQGVTCMMAAGEHWEPVERKKAGFTPSTDGVIH